MAHHPAPIVIHIVGTEVADNDRLCEEHVCCGEVLEEDVVVRLRRVQVVVDGREETAVAAVWVTGGMDCCRVGFLGRHMKAHASKDDDDTAERRLFHKNKGCCYATIITTLPIVPRDKVKVNKEGKDDNNNELEGGKKKPAACVTLE